MIPNIVIVLAIYCGLHLLHLIWTSKSIIYRCLVGMGILGIIFITVSTVKSSLDLEKQQAELARQQLEESSLEAKRIEQQQFLDSLGDEWKRCSEAPSWGISVDEYRKAFIEKGPDVMGVHQSDPNEAALFDKFERTRLQACARGEYLLEKGSESKEYPDGRVLTFERFKQLSSKPATAQASKSAK